jgi:CheY-like chemotaxis protein
MLTRRHHALLVYINHQLKQNGRPPSFQEMKEAVKAGSMSTVYRALSALAKQGYIARRHGRIREIQILRLPENGRAVPVAAHGDLLPVLSPASDLRTIAEAPTAGSSRDGRMAVDPPFRQWRETAESEATSGIQQREILPSLQALQMATEAIRRGYGMVEPAHDPEVVAQAIELSFLLVAYGLVPTKPGVAMARSATAGQSALILGASGASTGPNSQPRHTHKHILVVDDVSDVLVSVTAFLVSAGFVITTAADGDAALRLLANDPRIGVLVTDFVMPGLTGADLIVQAVQLRPNLKALLITGYPNADGLAELPPGVEVLAKPFRRAALIERVSALAGETAPALARSNPAQSDNAKEFANVSK